MSDTIEQARAQAISRVCDCEATTAYGHSTERCRQAGIDAIDALCAAVRAEAQREAFEAGWDAAMEDTRRWQPFTKAVAAYLTRQGQP